MGGGGGNSAQNAANAAEQQRQAQITATTAKIESIFSDPSRQAQYDKLGADTTAYYTSDLDRQNAIAQKKLKFSLARSGQVGGSEQAYQGKVLGEDYTKGLNQASTQGQQAAANLQNQDEQTKQGLIAMAQAGLDTTTASSEASSALRSNLQSGQAGATAQGLGDVFSDLGSVYQNSQDAKAQRQGSLFGYGSIFAPTYGSVGGYNTAAVAGFNYGPTQ
jgi:hypothetical protein